MVKKTIAHYELLDELGAGGMGVVYRALDTKLKREVALKVLPEEMASDPERLERFQREAETVATLNHPNIVTIHSVEEAEHVRFFTMELVDGKALSRLIPGGGMSLERICEIAIPLADALAVAHERGVIHRDLKPANLMVTGENRVKILDFGLAKLSQDTTEREVTHAATEPLTEEGRILGTLPYMSPEQLEGKDPDPRADVFSLGVILYEMATGERPFQGDTSISLISSIIKDTPREVDALRPDLPNHLGRVIRRCLAKSPDHRYQSSKDVRNELVDLKRTEIDSGVASRGLQTAARATERSLRQWVVYGVSGLLLLGAVGYGAWLAFAPTLTPEALPTASTATRKLIAILPLRNLGPAEDEYFAAGITDEIITRLAAVKGLGLISSSSTSFYRDSDARAKEIGEELGVDFVLSGSVRWARQSDGTSRVRVSPRLIRVEDNLLLWAKLYDRSIEGIFDIQSEIAVSVATELGAALLEPQRRALGSRPTANQEAYQAYLRGRFASVSVVCETVRSRIPYLRRAVELDPAFTRAWTTLSQGHSGAYAHCPEHAEQDQIESRNALRRAEELAAESWEVLAAKAQYFTQVERDYERALEPLEKASEQVDIREIHFAKARIYRRQGRWDEALAAFRRAAELEPKNLETRLPAVHMWMRNYDEAVEQYNHAIESEPEANILYLRKAWILWLWRGDTVGARAVLEALPTTEPSMLIQWGWFWQRVYERRYQEAVQGLDVVPDELMMQIHIFSSPKPLLMAQAFDLMGERELARNAYEQAREVLEAEVRRLATNSKVRSALAVAYAGLGRKSDALQTASDAAALVPIDKEPYFGGTTLTEVALVHTMVGEYDEALQELDALLGMPSLVSIAWLRLDPRWMPLWDLPGFQELVTSHGQESVR